MGARETGGKFSSLYEFCERVDARQVNRKVMESLIKCGAFDSLGPRRAQLMAVLDRALETAVVRQRDRVTRQKSFFDAFEAQDDFKNSFQKIPDVKDWPESQSLAWEKELLGFYVSGHPLARFEKVLKTFAGSTTKELPNLRGGSSVSVGGIITRLRKTATRKTNESMAILTLEDLEGEVEVLVWPKVYPKAVSHLEVDSPVFIKGKVNLKEETPRIEAEEVISLQEVQEKYTRVVLIHLFSAGLTEDALDSLKKILVRFPGKTMASLVFSSPGRKETVVSLGREFRVTPSEELTRGIEELLGEGTVNFSV